MPIRISPTLTLPDEALQYTAVRASGPGGQHVNTTSSAVQLRFDPAKCPDIGDAFLSRLNQQAGQKLTQTGEIIIESQKFRSQLRNKEDALEKLTALLLQAEIVPKRRYKTKPSQGAIRRRLEVKAHRSDAKKMRKKPEV